MTSDANNGKHVGQTPRFGEAQEQGDFRGRHDDVEDELKASGDGKGEWTRDESPLKSWAWCVEVFPSNWGSFDAVYIDFNARSDDSARLESKT